GDVIYDFSGKMPVATGVSLLLHGMLAIPISTPLFISALAPQSIAVIVTVLEYSGFPHLDCAAIKTVQDAAPYPPFPTALSAQGDTLEVVRTWQFRP
ncbi:MAG TPA: hypothetical protein DEX20_00005, partial [Halieaceae bacterium]|nr:hypothetical protein [Halieaceae bacterium]